MLVRDIGLVAFYTFASIATASIQVSYALPIFFKVLTDSFPEHYHHVRALLDAGPWAMSDNVSKWVSMTSIIWLFFSSAFVLLPTTMPVTSKNMNYAMVALAGVVLTGWTNWFLSAQFYYKGVKRHDDDEVFYDVENSTLSAPPQENTSLLGADRLIQT